MQGACYDKIGRGTSRFRNMSGSLTTRASPVSAGYPLLVALTCSHIRYICNLSFRLTSWYQLIDPIPVVYTHHPPVLADLLHLEHPLARLPAPRLSLQQSLHLVLLEEVHPRPVPSDVQVRLEQPVLLDPDLGEVVTAIVAKEQDSARFKRLPSVSAPRVSRELERARWNGHVPRETERTRTVYRLCIACSHSFGCSADRT